MYHDSKLKRFKNLEEIQKYAKNSTESDTNLGCLELKYAIALGNFDGLHLGHRQVIDSCKRIAIQNNLHSVVLTFDPHPTTLTKPGIAKNKKIYPLEYSLKLLENMGVDEIWVLNFTEELLTLDAKNFVLSLLQSNLRYLVTGYNFYFGFKRGGNPELLHRLAQELDFGYNEIPQITHNHHDVSSSYIKSMLKLGIMQTATELLGRPYMIGGVVQKGRGIAGAEFGIPTANITNPMICSKDDDDSTAPCNNDIEHTAYGVYVAYTYVERQKYRSIVNFGMRPTIYDDVLDIAPVLEVHLFDYDCNKSLVGQQLIVELLQFLRPEVKFNSVEQLKNQIDRDVSLARYVHQNLHK